MAGICFVLCNMKRKAITLDLSDSCGNHYFTPPGPIPRSCISKYPGNQVSVYYLVAVEIVAKTIWSGFKKVLQVFCWCIFPTFDCINPSRNPASKTEHLANNGGLWHNAFKLWIHFHPETLSSDSVCGYLCLSVLVVAEDKDKAFFSSSLTSKNCCQGWEMCRMMTRHEMTRGSQSHPWWSWLWCGKLCGLARDWQSED